MSVWKKLQRVGKKAAKFKITISLNDITIESKPNANLENLQISFRRRSRKFSSDPFSLKRNDENLVNHTWALPHNIELTTTLYRSVNDICFEEKEWTFQLEESNSPGHNGKSNLLQSSYRKKILSTSQLNIGEYVGQSQCQSQLKIVMRITSKNFISVVLNVQLFSVLIQEGDAVDDDLLSLDSMASFQRGSSFSAGQGITAEEFKSNFKRRGTFNVFSKKKNEKPSILENPDNDLNFEDLSKKFESLAKISDDIFSVPMDRPKSAQESKEEQEENHNDEDIFSRGPTGQQILEWFNGIYQKLDQEVINNYQIPRPVSMNSFRNGRIIGGVIHHHFPDKIDLNVLNIAQDDVSTLKYVTNLCYKEFGLPPLLNSPNVDALSIITYLNELKTFFMSGKDKLGINRFFKRQENESTNVTDSVVQQNSQAEMRLNDPNYDKVRLKAKQLIQARANQLETDGKKETKSRFANYFEEVEKEVKNNSREKTQPDPVRRLNSLNKKNVRDVKKKNSYLLNVDGSSRKSSSGTSTANNSNLDPDGNHPVTPQPVSTTQMNKNSNLKKTNSILGISSYQNTNSNLKWLKMNNLNLFTTNQVNSPNQNGRPEGGGTQHSQSMVEISYGTRAQDFVAMDSDQIDYKCMQFESNRLAEAQAKLDERANELERTLRACSSNDDRSPEQIMREDEILKEWLQLVNQKSTLIRRSHQLAIIQKENDLKKKAEILRRELAEIMNRDESRITEADRRLEKTLMEKLLRNVDERDAIVQELELQEEAIAMDQRMTEESKKLNRILFNDEFPHLNDQDKNCILM